MLISLPLFTSFNCAGLIQRVFIILFKFHAMNKRNNRNVTQCAFIIILTIYLSGFFGSFMINQSEVLHLINETPSTIHFIFTDITKIKIRMKGTVQIFLISRFRRCLIADYIRRLVSALQILNINTRLNSPITIVTY